MPFRRICQLNRLYPHTLYRKLDLIHRKCIAFVSEQERKLPKMRFERLYLSTDRQTFLVNWSSRRDRTDTLLTSIATADNISRYVFGGHLNFDPTVDANAAEEDAISTGDIQKPAYLRRQARIVFYADQLRRADEKSGKQKRSKPKRRKKSADDEIISRPPDYGAQIGEPYVMHAHFEFLRRLLVSCKTFRSTLDPDAGMPQTCLAMFHREISADRVEAFVVRINKKMTRPEREKAIATAWLAFEEQLAEINERLALGDTLDQLEKTPIDRLVLDWEADLEQPSREDLEQVFARRQAMTKRERRKAAQDKQARDVGGFVRRLMIRRAMRGLRADKDGARWLRHPMPRLDEPQKQVWRITDRGMASSISEESVAHLYDRASLHAIDNFFQLARRNFSSLERSPNTARRGRLHYIYMPFDPMTVARLLDIHRTHFNFVKTGQDGRTPAMRLGLVDRPYTEEDILTSVEPVPPNATTKPVRKRKPPAAASGPINAPAAADAPV